MSDDREADDAAICDPSTMAKFLLMTERTVNRLAAEGVLVRAAGRGRFDLVASVQGYVRFLRKNADHDLQGGAQIVGLRTRLIDAKTRLAESEADEAAGRMLLKADVEAVWLRIVTNMRTRMLALPTRVAPLLQAAASPGEAAAILTDAVHDALADLAATEVTVPSTRAGRVSGADRPGADDLRDDGAASEADNLAVG